MVEKERILHPLVCSPDGHSWPGLVKAELLLGLFEVAWAQALELSSVPLSPF